MKTQFLIGILLILTFTNFYILNAEENDEYKIKREEIYEFTTRPKISREGDRVEINFESKGFCDATVVIENAEGQIMRHLASGVLGKNAPEPFQKNSLKQVIEWDGKDDSGNYLKTMSGCSVRVSLGLKPQFEKSLFWHPKKRNGIGRGPLIVPQPEGVYVYEGDGIEQIRMYDHEGNYARTVYPFPLDKIKDIKGLSWNTMPDGFKAPKKIGYWTSTLLTGGLARTDTNPGDSAHMFAVNGGKIALAAEKLSRLSTDGSPTSFDLYGPDVSNVQPFKMEVKSGIRPKASAFSSDGKYLYLTEYFHRYSAAAGLVAHSWNNGIYRMEFAKNDSPTLWLGTVAPGKENSLFDMPASICVDNEGRVYVADYGNDRVQIFDSEGKHLNSFLVESPASIQVHQKTGQIYVFSWAILGTSGPSKKVKPFLRIFSPFQDIKKTAEIPLSFQGYSDTAWYSTLDSNPFRASLDSWSETPTIWMFSSGTWDNNSKPERYGIELYIIKDNKLILKQSWQKEVIESLQRWQPAPLARQRLYVSPQDGALFVAEGDVAYAKAFTTLLRIDPITSKINQVNLPISAEELAFDREGFVYLRTTELLARFNPTTWKEIPFDYGEERKTKFASDAKGGEFIGGMTLPSAKPFYWHQQGMDVNANGDIAIFCVNQDSHSLNSGGGKALGDGKDKNSSSGSKQFTPENYPGRLRYGELHIFDKYGKIKVEDAVKGVPRGHSTQMDQYGNLYVLIIGSQIKNGKPVFSESVCTVFKFKPGKGKFISSNKNLAVPVGDTNKPNFPQQLAGFWVEDYEWMYSGIGFATGDPCQCWNCRFVVDYLGRSFVPENLRGQVAIIDTNGNLITHVGRPGNVDDGKPLVLAGGPANPRSIGGDEVSLMFANYVGTHTDKRLFIADPGNLRILSVKLGYQVEEKLAIQEEVNTGKK